MVISPDRKNNLNIISTNKINTPNYSKIPIDINKRMAKSPNFGKTFNINNDYYSDYKVLNYNGKKIFVTYSFNGFNSLTKNNSPEENENRDVENEANERNKENEQNANKTKDIENADELTNGKRENDINILNPDKIRKKEGEKFNEKYNNNGEEISQGKHELDVTNNPDK